MKTFRVEFYDYIIKANNEEEAMQVAMEELKQGCGSDLISEVREEIY